MCGEARFQVDPLDTLTNPNPLDEVLSPKIERFDRGLTFAADRLVDSFQDEVPAARDRTLVERSTRLGARLILADLRGQDDVLRPASITCAVPLSEVHARVNFAKAARRLRPTARDRDHRCD